MLDYRFIKDNIEAVELNIANRNMKADARLVVSLFDERTALITALQELQQRRNENARSMKGSLSPEARAGLIDEGKKLKEEIAVKEKTLSDTEARLEEEGRKIPNMAHPDAPVGVLDTDNPEVKRVGTPRSFDFPVKDHVQIGETLDLVDFEAATKVSGQ
ncbi:MAG: serine--tRNA ligase, partial [Spirochaetaceae bacterium]|nr:serine--tRNA ligase [Spirochaetaceae bacterium]